ncbi:MAG: [FeFe] hydrogenase, group A [Defluviitaleaceae bacterium]|nr:[FeFe] hydrogenase, group A [Defluviitaleaceae bacterium]
MEKFNFTINGCTVEAVQGETIMQAAKRAGVDIPRLCYTEMSNTGVTIKPVTCRVCEVEIIADGGEAKIMAACVAPAKAGLTVHTKSKAAVAARKQRVENLLADHPQDCLACSRNLNCELQTLASDLGIRKINKGDRNNYPIDESSPSIVRDPNKCVLCKRCEAVCSKVQTVNALECKKGEPVVDTRTGKAMGNTDCVNCGQCTVVCPTAALTIKDDTQRAWDLLNDPNKFVVVQIAPSVRSGIGEMFGLGIGVDGEKKLVAGLRQLGFDKVYNTNFSADLTIMEEGTELIERVTKGGTLPLITSCCPGWVKFAETEYPDLLDHVSSCKSPQEMFSAVAKTYMPTKLGVDPSKMVCISIMPCTAKKYEAARPEFKGNTDLVLTTQEIGWMLKQAGINLATIEDGKFDAHFAEAAGAGEIFGATGGVCEAALRTVYEVVTGETLASVDFEVLRGFEGSAIKTATVKVGDLDVKVAVAHELRNARVLMDELRAGTSPYHFIEIMACPGGCVNGAGQPSACSSTDTVAARRDVLYTSDKNNKLRKSHENPEIKALYDEFLGSPYHGENAHKLLHTTYTKRNKDA